MDDCGQAVTQRIIKKQVQSQRRFGTNPPPAYKPRPKEPNNPFMLEGFKKRPSLSARLLFQRVALVGKEIKLGSKLPYCRKSCTDYHSKEAIDKSIKIKAEEDKMLHAMIATEKYPKMLMAIPLIQRPIKIIFPIIHLGLSGKIFLMIFPKECFTCKGWHLDYGGVYWNSIFERGSLFSEKQHVFFCSSISLHIL
jgi:hypothetical protein